MKEIIIFMILLIITTGTFSQQTKPSPALTKQDYLKKSKSQKTAAWIMLGGGTTLMIIGIASVSTDDAANYIFGGDQSGFNTGMILFYTGILSVGGSIPLFIASGRNKRKAASLSFRNQFLPQMNNRDLVKRPVPSLHLKINL